jgi:hypothetical protein
MPDYPRGSGVPHRGPVLEVYADSNALSVACESCGVGQNEYCVWVDTAPTERARLPRKLPCAPRIQAAGKATK